MNCIFSHRSTSKDDKKIISDWLIKTDGEFVIYALNKKSKDFVILNDVLGRLPIYYFCKEGNELLSIKRNCNSYHTSFRKVMITMITMTRFDRMGIAQFLLFSHTLGKRTLLSEYLSIRASYSFNNI